MKRTDPIIFNEVCQRSEITVKNRNLYFNITTMSY